MSSRALLSSRAQRGICRLSFVLLAACAGAPKAPPIGRVETQQVRGNSMDVLVVTAAFPARDAPDRIALGFERRGMGLNPETVPRRMSGHTTKLVSCESVVYVNSGPSNVQSRAPTTCYLVLDVNYEPVGDSTRLELSGHEYSRAGNAGGMEELRLRSKNWREVQELARAIVNPTPTKP